MSESNVEKKSKSKNSKKNKTSKIIKALTTIALTVVCIKLPEIIIKYSGGKNDCKTKK